MPHLFRAGQLSFFDRGGVRLMLDKPEFDDPSSILYSGSAIFVRPTGALGMPELNFADEPHVIAEMPSYDLWMMFFRDSKGKLLRLVSEMPRVS